MASHFYQLAIKDIRRETADCVSLSFIIPPALAERFRFRQGQNVTLRATLEGEDIRRSYSICSSPLDNELRVAVKRVANGRFSVYANDRLQPGDLLDVLPPSGKFYTELDPRRDKKYLAFAAGSGITPLLSIIRTTLATEVRSEFTLVYGSRSRGSIIFREQLEALKDRYMDRFTLHHILSREKTDTPVGRGRIGPEKCREMDGKLISFSEMDEIFLCGPKEMIFGVRDWLENQQGFDPKKIHFELFHTPGMAGEPGGVSSSVSPGKKDPAGKSGRVVIRLDGNSVEFDLPYEGAPILDAALLEGIDLPYACKGGVCCTCRARVTEGEVYMETNYALEADELAAGFVLTCQSHPRTARVVVDFDNK
ncbi:MAG: phenylacetate-CoA oxygenase/reductase subunit PaaK [Puia sp.]|nr:phenylacetate-CoA oxygenase/reductase subunit PaaK [Puia sp.]